jgi:hypothetical protein
MPQRKPPPFVRGDIIVAFLPEEVYKRLQVVKNN